MKYYIKRYHSVFKLRYLQHLIRTMQKYRDQIIRKGITLQDKNTVIPLSIDEETLWGLNYEFNYMKTDVDKMVLWMGKNT